VIIKKLKTYLYPRISKVNLILLVILIFGTFLRFYKIQSNLVFGGEMGYDYMTIRTYVENHQIPLIGPRTSHEWFFIGPLFYWIFCLLLPVFNYSVLVGSYFFGTVGVISIIVCYWTVKTLFGEKVGLISSFLISFSPLWIQITHDARFNAMTAVLFFPFYYFLVKSIRDQGRSLFKLGIILGIMFSFFPSPILLLPGAAVTIFIYRKRINNKYIIPGILGFVIPNIPYLIYNALHKFEIIGNLLIWIPYRVMGFFGLYPKNTVTLGILQNNIKSLYTFFQQSYLQNSDLLTIILFIAVLIFTVIQLKKNLPLQVLAIIAGISYLGIFINGDPPQHYYLVMYPVPIILLSLFIIKLSKKYLWVTVLICGYLLFMNLQYYFSNKWFYINSTRVSDDYNYVPYGLQLKISKFIANDAGSSKFKLARAGQLDFFRENYSLNYHYLLWGLGKKPDQSAELIYTIYENTSNLPANTKFIWIENVAISKAEVK
jgi:hypothetical protein